MPPDIQIPTTQRPPAGRRGPRRREALRGVKLGLRGHAGFAVHVFTAALIGTGAIALACDVAEWAVLLCGVGALFAAELFHGAIRQLVPHLAVMPDADRERCRAMAAGATLVVRVTVMAVAVLIFVNRLLDLLRVFG